MPYYPPGPVLATVATNSVTTDDQTFALDAGTQVIFEQSDGDDILVLTESNGGILHKFHSAFGAGAEIDFSPFFAFAFYPVILIEETVTLANTGEVAGIADYLIVNPSVDTADYCIAADIEVYSQTGNVNDIGGLIGVYGEARHQGSGVVPTLAGLYYFSTNNSSGPVTAQFGAYLDVKNPGSGVVTLKEGLHIATMTAGGVVTVQRGINVAPVSGAATNYAIQTAAGHVVFNEDSHDDTDFRVEGATDTHLLFTDGSANFVGIGTSAPSNKFHTLLSDAVTAAITNVGRLSHNSTGTAAAGFGPGLIFGGKSSTTNDQDMGRLTYEWATATHASRAGRGKLTAFSVATEVECIQWDATGLVSIRASGAGIAAGLYVPWITGDTLATLVAGSSTAGNNRTAITGTSNSSVGVKGDTTSGTAIQGTSTSGTGGYFISASAAGVIAQSSTGVGLDVLQLTGTNNALNDLVIVRKRPLTTAANGFGASIVYKLSSDTTIDQLAGRLTYEWATATHASRKARGKLTAYDTAEREVIRFEADGAAAMLAFYGSAAVAKQTVTGSRGANAALADLLTKLATLGLIIDGSS